MVLRNLRWLVAGVAAVIGLCASPARSSADVTILVEELNGSSVVASQSTTIASASVLPTNVTPTFTGQFFTGSAVVSTNSGSSSLVASLVPSFNGQLTSSFDVTQNHTLRITVTDTSFIPQGPAGSLKVEVSGSTGFANGTQSIDEKTRIFDPATNQTITLIDSLQSADGTKQTNTSNVSGLPSPYAIQQTLTLSYSGDIPANATFGATGGASITTNAVPAPSGLLLGLIALPLVGLRRALRNRVPAAV